MSSLLRLRLPLALPRLARPFSSTPVSLKPSSPSSRSRTSTPAVPPPSRKANPDPRPRRVLTFETKSGTSHLKTYLPVTPSLRQLRLPVSPFLHKGQPLRALTVAKRSTGGRNDSGKITVRARGGGHKRRIRLVDTLRKESGEQDVVRIEYDPGRSAHVALIRHKETGDVSYILAPEGLREGHVVRSFRAGIPDSFTTKDVGIVDEEAVAAPRGGSDFLARRAGPSDPSSPQTVLPPPPPGMDVSTESAPTPSAPAARAAPAQIDLGVLRSVALLPGNCLPLRLIPPGTPIHNITLSPTGPFILARSAGVSARIVSIPEGSKHAQVKLGSGEIRLVGLECFACVGEVGNGDWGLANLGKAGRMRWLGFRPQSRGMAMNAYVSFSVLPLWSIPPSPPSPRCFLFVHLSEQPADSLVNHSTDHPHGGGRGKSQGNRNPVDPWGNPTKGARTRSPKSPSGNKMVVKERPRGTEKGR
jgi:ribosomal protein L2